MEERNEDVPLPVKVALVFNLKRGKDASTDDAEAEYDGIDTVNAIRDALVRHGYNVGLYEADESLAERLMREKPDIAFNIAEGRTGRAREAQIPALLSLLGIPFTGSDETTLCIALDKALTKRLLATYHIKTPRYAVFEPENTIHTSSLRFPAIIKPNAEGSSKGISEFCIARSAQELIGMVRENQSLYHEPVLAEEYIEGREFTVGILGNGTNMRVFRPMEISYKRGTQGDYHVYSYQVKQDYKRYVDYACPADITPELEKSMTNMARKAFEALGCRDFARVDFRVDKDETPYFIEINPLPGLAPNYSDYPMLAEFCGVAYDELVAGVLESALLRLGLRKAAYRG